MTSIATRRNILSYVSSFFDPPGSLSPVILTAELLLQRLCKLKFEWDQIIEGVELDLWSKWSRSIQLIQNAVIPRTHVPLPTVTTQGPKKDNVVCCSSSLRKFNPFLFDGILRVDGRLQDATLPFETKYPVILPSKHFVTHLTIEHCHTLNGRAGLNFVVSNLRQKYWILKAAKTVKSLLKDCFKCRRWFGQPCQQVMAPLPADRT
ncbi:hypothetical protein X801_03808, partial [Opisthorchis viverrini]